MSRRSIAPVLALFLLLIAVSPSMAKSYTPKANTRAAIKAYVDRAVKLVARKGPVCDTFKNKSWMAGDYYVFVIGPDDRTVCHPNPSMIGKLSTEIVDANGKKVGAELVAAGRSRAGHGWVDYVWPRPGQTTPVPKSSYVVRVKAPNGKAYIVGSGGYELK